MAPDIWKISTTESIDLYIHTPPTGSLRAIRELRWVRVSVMVRLGTKAQKLNIGKKCCLSGKSWTKLDLRALTFVGTTYQTTNIGVVP